MPPGGILLAKIVSWAVLHLQESEVHSRVLPRIKSTLTLVMKNTFTLGSGRGCTFFFLCTPPLAYDYDYEFVPKETARPTRLRYRARTTCQLHFYFCQLHFYLSITRGAACQLHFCQLHEELPVNYTSTSTTTICWSLLSSSEWSVLLRQQSVGPYALLKNCIFTPSGKVIAAINREISTKTNLQQRYAKSRVENKTTNLSSPNIASI